MLKRLCRRLGFGGFFLCFAGDDMLASSAQVSLRSADIAIEE